MRRTGLVLPALLLLAGSAYAQPRAGSSSIDQPTFYVEGVAESSFGNVTSQSYGGEAGVTIWSTLQVFVEAGHTLNVAPSSLGASAQQIAGYLTQVQSGTVGYSVKEPSTFGTAGFRWAFPVNEKLEPYVLAGFGVAQVTNNVHFTVGGADVTSSLAQYGVVLGSDLSGSAVHPLLTIGGGVAIPLGRFVIDVRYRYGRIITSDQTLNVNRVGAGLGIRF